MIPQILIIGGAGRIGSNVARDLVTYTRSEITITGRNPRSNLSLPVRYISLDLNDAEGLQIAIDAADLVIHCAGPFHHRDAKVIKICIDRGVDYLDVSDHRSFTQKALSYCNAATKAGVTAIVNTGVFPGISNSMARQGVAYFDEPESLALSYVVSGSGGAGLTVMRTTFLGLQDSFLAWLDGEWKQVKPYSDRTLIQLPPPFNQVGVYWYDVSETFTLAKSFPVKTVITKFGSHPDFYNYLTWMVARWCPQKLLQNNLAIEFLAKASYGLTVISDRFSGIGIAMRVEVKGKKDSRPARYCATLIHENTAVAAGCGTGAIAEFILTGKLHKPGVWPVEQVLTTELFEQGMRSRNIEIEQTVQS